MMRWLVASSLKFRRFVVVAAVAAIVVGIAQLGDTRTDLLPEFTPPTVEVQTEALGLSAPEVEQLVTSPLEQQLLNGVPFLDEISSESVPGLSSITLIFEPGTDLLDARQMVAERLTLAHALPNVSRPPQMLQPLSSMSRVMTIGLSSRELSPIDMSVLARWVIGPRLLGVEGVANVAIWGQRERQLQVQIDPERLRGQGVSLNEIIETAGNALEVSPLTFLEASTPGTGGWIDTANQRLHIFHEQAISTPEELAQVAIEDSPGRSDPLTLGDVTEVVEDHQPLIGDAVCPDGACLLLVVEKFPEANTPEVTRGVDLALGAMRPGLPSLEMDTSLYRPARFIEASFLNLRRALLIGAVLLVAVIGAFFYRWRTALICVAVIPLSLVVAGIVLYLRATTLNAMILAGLVMSLVLLIDDAVIDVEHAERRLWGDHQNADSASVPRSIARAALEIRTTIFYATLVVVAAVVPLFFLEGEADAFLPPLVLTYVLAVAASTAVALIVTPGLSALLLANAHERRESPVVRWLQERYDNVAPRMVSRTSAAFVPLGALVLAGLLVFPFLDTSLGPSFEERDVLIHVDAAPGTSLPRMRAITEQAVRELGSLPGVRNVGAHVGRAVQSDRTVNVNAGDIWVSTDPSAEHDTTMGAIADVIRDYPELSNEVVTYSDDRVAAVLQRPVDEIVVRIYGENEEALRGKAEEVRALVAEIGGVEGARVELPPEEPTLEVEVDLGRAQAFGVKPGDVRRAAATLLSGITVGHLFEDQKVFDVVVWGGVEIRQNEADLRALLIDTPDGGHVRLGELADVRIASSPAVLRHESVSTYLDVSADVEGRNVGAVGEEVQQALRQVEFPMEHHAELLGGFADRQAARSRVISVAAAAAIGIFLLLQAAFASWRLAVLAVVIVPVALVGGALASLATGRTISLGSIAGFIAVLGIAVRGVALLIRGYQRLERGEGESFGPELVMRGTRDRLAPTVATMLAIAALLLPVVVAGAGGGLEIVHPMAVVILGGLVTSTLVTLFLVPALYLRFGFVAEPDATDEDLLVSVPDLTPARAGLGP